MAKKISFEEKLGLQNDPEIPRKNKLIDIDVNEIKEVVNYNAEELNAQIENIGSKDPSNAEVVQARGGYKVLNERLDNSDRVKAEKEELEKVKEKTEVNSSRIDEFTKLPEGSTTGNAELLDIRIGADGKTYSNAGSAVREQVNSINNNINNLKDELLGLKFNTDNTTEGYYINANDGKVTQNPASSQFKITDFINLENASHIYVKKTFHYGGDGLAFYDFNEKYISGFNEKADVGNKYVLLEVPKGAKYFRLSAFKSENIEVYRAKIIPNLINEVIPDIEKRIEYLEDEQGSQIDISKVDYQEKIVLNIDEKNILLSTNSKVISELNKDENIFNVKMQPSTSAGNSWLYFKEPFVPMKWDSDLYIEFDLEKPSDIKIELWISNGGYQYSGTNQAVLINIPIGEEKTHIKYSIDPSYYSVYKDPAWEKFNFWFVMDNNTTGEIKTYKISNLKIYQKQADLINVTGNSALELIESIDNNIENLKNNMSDVLEKNKSANLLISPNGEKFEISINNLGQVSSIPIIPSKGAFFGNSLIGGSGYGMAASDSEHDYYYLINSFIESINSGYIYNRYPASYCSQFEALINENEIDSAVKKMTDALTGDENLISIQLGDNVNTVEKNAVFPKSSLELCKAVRKKCPNARVVWMGMWYGSEAKYTAIRNACKKTGCHFIDFLDIIGPDSNSYIGAIQKQNMSSRHIENIISLEEIDNKIKIEFEVNDKRYESVVPVENYELNNNILSYTGEYSVITSAGVASHPGNEGMRKIANKFLYNMYLTEVEEYYSKNDLNIH